MPIAPTGAASAGAPGELTHNDDVLVHRGLTGSRLLLVRGIAQRAISLATNFGLLALVAPAELGLLAVTRAAFVALQLGSELGFELAMVRRGTSPSRAELAAHTGLRVLVLGAFFVAAALLEPVRTLDGLIPRDLQYHMLFAMGVFVISATQSSCRIRMERELAFGPLALIEVNGLLLQNVALVGFAMAGRFGEGIFLVQAVTSAAVTVALWRASSLIPPSFRLRALRPLWRESTGFTLTAVLALVRDSGTPLTIARVFGLEVAGLWAFAVRIGQQALVALEGYARAGLPVSAQLGDPATRRDFASRMLRESAAITFPLAAVAAALVPLIGTLLPQWQAGIGMAQAYLLGASVLGVAHTATWLVALARVGAVAAVGELVAWIAATGVGLLLLYLTGSEQVILAVLGGSLAGLLTLRRLTPADERPALVPLFDVPLAVLVLAFGLHYGAAAIGLGVVGAAVAGALPPLALLTRKVARRVPRWWQARFTRKDPTPP